MFEDTEVRCGMEVEREEGDMANRGTRAEKKRGSRSLFRIWLRLVDGGDDLQFALTHQARLV